ncbi:uncharacterized protein LOC129770799 [Toxorhynchites rutilus septentrionalis]|uniref:uncharacterized protein LOC129770799 n=1 Tax=Toxorhynchites rutilus septentrionalis TaxID=329112 RepID=UPI0024786095|nr:uncharacterized protein LOC129770799 [Toxorhynchites rutilus septentrionalis]
MAEFLPLCDVLFNVISLAGYFCDVVFDIVLGYALYERQKFAYFTAVIVIVSFSLIISQVVSVRWYLNKRKLRSSSTATAGPPPDSPENSLEKRKKQVPVEKLTKTAKYSRYVVLALHATQLGVLWRYAKLFVPVDLRHVKHEVRDLCMLRLVHAFCEAAPMLLLQLYVLVNLQHENHLSALKLRALASGHHLSSTALVQQANLAEQQQKTFRDLNMVSATLSLFSVCWALASFSKNVRLQNVHRLVLTWLGVIFQFLWRLGTVISRVISLTVYASVYSHWVFLVIILHWFSMFLWLISPKNVFHGERISRLKKVMLGGLIAFVYIFAYINLQEVRHRQKMLTFYVVMFMENCLLVCLWMVGIWHSRPEGWYTVPISVLSSFAVGLFFMVVYYRYFHVRRLGYEAGGRAPCEEVENKCGHCNEACRCLESSEHLEIGKAYGGCGAQKYPHAIPGVFNCRFSNPVNAATKRKKKKPTTFVPPPALAIQTGGTDQAAAIGPMAIPFWRRPLPRSHTGGSSENEGSSVGSRVNIQQKLQEKKQKQLAELKIIEEEIKQGKLGGPGTGTLSSGDDGKATLPRQPIPRVKKHIDIDPMEWRPSSPDMAEITVEKSFNDLNLLLAANLDDVNNLNKFNSNYDPIYNSFGLNGINISTLVNMKNAETQQASVNNRNMSPISSQISATESNSLTRQVHPRSKILPNNVPRNPFENYRGNFVNLYADAAANNNRPPSISPRTTEIATSNRAVLYDNHSRLYMEASHPRQISGTYSSIENAGTENLPFPYNVIPPPRSKLDSRATPTMSNNPSATNTGSSSGNNNSSNNASGAVPASAINNLNNTKRQMQRAKTPEILLAPHYLENSRIYYDWVAREAANLRLQEAERNQSVVSSGDENLDNSAVDDGNNLHRVPSDIDSQVSLPRSYTLPREFKYYRRNKGRKVIKNEHFIASTNSSDGDVDSGDDNESEHHSNVSNNSQQRLKNATPNSNLGAAQKLHNLNKTSANVHYGQSSSPNATLLPNGGGSAVVSVANSRQTLNATPQNLHMVNGYGNNLMTSNSAKQVHSLDLINGVDSAAGGCAAAGGPMSYNSRPMRLRMYGAKNGMVRHETKL